MKRLRRSVQPCTAGQRRASHRGLRRINCATIALGASFAALAPAWAQAPGAPSAQTTQGLAPSADAASPAEIVAARELFRQGTEDADAGRYAAGLEKFRRVAAVKETGAVRFNIARCEDALGKTGAALADFELAAREAHDDPKSGDVGTLATQRADALRPKVPRLTVIPPTPAPPGLALSLDGARLASATFGAALPVDPGAHVIDAKAPGGTFHAQVTLAEGEAKKVTVTLVAEDVPSLPPGPPDAPGTPADAPSSSSHTWGWISLAAGGALAAGSGLFLLLHDNAVTTINGECPAGHCPAAQETQINGTVSQARLYEGLSIGLIAGSGLAIGAGIALFATAPKSTATASKAPATSLVVTAGAPAAPAGLSIHGSF